MSKFVYLDTEERSIEDKKYYCIFILEMQSHNIFKIFKIVNEPISTKLKNLKIFQDVSSQISYVIKRDGRISLDISL